MRVKALAELLSGWTGGERPNQDFLPVLQQALRTAVVTLAGLIGDQKPACRTARIEQTLIRPRPAGGLSRALLHVDSV